ncbi:MAG: hypothetical protein AAGA54_02085 [Myxococcota bacterium]
MFGFSRFPQLALATASLAALLVQSGCTCGSQPYQGDYYDGDRPGSMKGYKFVESEKVDPKIAGCADGQREGFADVEKNPRIAGCMAKWKEGKSLRDKPTGKACGDDGDECTVPADACAPGWHVCGMEGKSDDLKTRTTQKECDNAGPGRFNAAMSHSPTDEIDPCPRITKNTDLPCVQAGIGAEPVCCGNDCLGGKCKDAVWKGKTRISRGTTEGCGAVTSDRNGGVLCCYDGDDKPAAGGDAPAAAEGGEEKPAEEGAAEAGDAKPAEEGKADAADAKPAEEGKADAKPNAKEEAKEEKKAE